MSERLVVGAVLAERFEILRFLGAGSFGEVYQARQLVLGVPMREVALKVFKSAVVTPANVGHVLTDVLMLVRLLEQDPPEGVSRRVSQIYDVGVLPNDSGDRVFMSMQLIPGKRTLEQEIRRHKSGGMPVALSLWYLERLLVPLAWMHAQGIVHGDLKPDNVLLRQDKDIVLTDFGLTARAELGVQGGTLVWSAPESLASVGGDVQSDVYSLGLIWYAMLTGHSLFAKVGLAALGAGNDSLYKQAQLLARKCDWAAPGKHVGDDTELRSPLDFNEELAEHPGLVQLLQRCLAYRVGDRCPHAGMVLEAVRGYAQSRQLPAWIADATTPNSELFSADLPVIESSETDKAIQATLDQAKTLANNGQQESALVQLGSAIKRWPNEPALFVLMADLYEEVGQITLANRFRRMGQASARK